MSENERFLDPDFNPADATVTDLIRFLSSNNVSLPTNREKKQFYINLFVINRAQFAKIQPKASETIQVSAALEKETLNTPRRATRGTPMKAVKLQLQEIEMPMPLVADNTPIKKRPVSDLDPVFTKDNPFQSPRAPPANANGAVSTPKSKRKPTKTIMTPGIAPRNLEQLVFSESTEHVDLGFSKPEIGRAHV